MIRAWQGNETSEGCHLAGPLAAEVHSQSKEPQPGREGGAVGNRFSCSLQTPTRGPLVTK